MISVTGLPNDRDPQRCTAGARGTNFHDFRDRPSKRQSPTEMHRRSGLIFFFFDLCILFPMPFFEKIETRVCITHPFSEKKEKSRRQSCSAHACFVFCHRRLRKKLAGPAFTTQKSKRKLLQIMMVMHRVSLYIYAWASSASPSPRWCVVLLVSLSFGRSFGVVARSSRDQVHRDNLFDGMGRVGLHILVFGFCRKVFLKEFAFLLDWLWACFWGHGWFINSPFVVSCGLFVGARRGRLPCGSLRLDNGGRKNCISRWGLACMNFLPAMPTVTWYKPG